jgi:muramoyltetrapeptide carboxypeptidase
MNEMVPVLKLNANATIGIFSPSEPIVESRKARFERGISILESYGYQTKLGNNCLKIANYTAGSISQRLEDIHDLVKDPEVNALVASWGGKSCNQLIRHLDFEEILKQKKPIMGFSDGCVLLNSITANTGLVTFHGPNVVGKLHETRHASLEILRDPNSRYNLNLLGGTSSERYEVVKGGVATGCLFGGNLSTFVLGIVCSYIPIDYYKDGIFFWEEASMPPQIIDQYLTALKNIGILDGISGMIIGDFISEDELSWKRADAFSVMRSILSEYDYPILYAPTFGHAPLENPILPIGAEVSLDANSAKLSLLKPIL